MANGAHLAKLKAGVRAWNAWRDGQPEDSPDLYGADLTGADLTGANLSGADLSDAKLAGANLRDANLGYLRHPAGSRTTKLVCAVLTEADLTGAKLNGADLTGANLSGADLTNASLACAKLTGANLAQAKLTGVDLAKQKLKGVDLAAMMLAGVDLRDTNFADATLPGADLSGANLSYSNFTGADIRSQQLRCWLVPEDLQTGNQPKGIRDEIIAVCDMLVLVVSEHSLGSAWMETEMEKVAQRQMKESKPTLYPIFLGDAVLKFEARWAGYLRHISPIDDFETWKDDEFYQGHFNLLMYQILGAPLSKFAAPQPEINHP
jgi:uncharacterized protein YjbI with pentapeptide repeats